MGAVENNVSEQKAIAAAPQSESLPRELFLGICLATISMYTMTTITVRMMTPAARTTPTITGRTLTRGAVGENINSHIAQKSDMLHIHGD